MNCLSQDIARHGRALRAAAALFVTALLVGCAGPTPTPTEPSVTDERVERAESLADEGRPLAAVREFRRLADDAGPAEAQRWRLRAVELLFEHEYPELALEWHGQLDSESVPLELRTRKQVVDAQAAVAQRQGIRALRLLPATVPDMPDDLRARVLATRADAYRLTGQPALALIARIEREPLLAEDQPVSRNHREIWAILETMPVARLELFSQIENAPELRGWANLAQAVRGARFGRQRVSAAIESWREEFPEHPAGRAFADTLQERVAAESAYPEHVALLLPLSGPLADAGTAIRDGMFAAYYGQPDRIQRPEIEVYDTAGEPQGAVRAYQRAISDGAEFIVGPLAKSGVAAVAESAARGVRILSLNYLADDETEPPQAMYQFGLLPEDEARQAAEAAVQNGHLNALVLVPAGDWGERMASAFDRRFDELGGVVLEHGRYDADTTDYGDAIQRLFDLDTSYARARQVRSTIGERARFEPRRRQDAELVFVAAMPRQARLVKPQLEFHRAADLPIYATSHIFTGTPDPDSDWDMNGLYFTDTPWILENLQQPEELYRRVVEHWPEGHSQYPRLYALGIDAFTMLPHLDRMGRDAANTLSGRTGLLALDEQGRVYRQLHWAQMRRGVPVPVSRPGADDALDAEALTDEAS